MVGGGDDGVDELGPCRRRGQEARGGRRRPGRSRCAARCSRPRRRTARRTVASQAAKVGIVVLELPQATSSRSGSTLRIARAVSAASRPYSSAVLCPICQGPSSSLPRHQTRTPCGSLAPLARRRSDRPGALGVVGVLQQVDGLGHPAGAEVHRHHRLDALGRRPRHELVDADRVGSSCARRGRAGAAGRPPARRRPPSGSRRRSCRPGSARSWPRAPGPGRGRRRGTRPRRRWGGRARRSPCRRSAPCARRRSRTGEGRPPDAERRVERQMWPITGEFYPPFASL